MILFLKREETGRLAFYDEIRRKSSKVLRKEDKEEDEAVTSNGDISKYIPCALQGVPSPELSHLKCKLKRFQ